VKEDEEEEEEKKKNKFHDGTAKNCLHDTTAERPTRKRGKRASERASGNGSLDGGFALVIVIVCVEEHK
jgi:hypothetical protein|tara:strand:- start:3520 stop:3726 length:207 start_codon:yes stop_codon:yes gene_type:complete